MRRLCLATVLLGLVFNGCAVVVDPVTADPAPIRATQFLRPTLDSQTGTWVAAWVDPENFAASFGAESDTTGP